MSHERYMKRAFELASLGIGQVSPNPMVGCVIVYNDQVIAEGWHKKYGGPHAEVEAINQVKDPVVLSDATCYVTLEPCSHFGKTPPCADLLVKKGLRKVVIANTDPNPKVNGQGVQKLRDAGIEVLTGIMESEGLHLNRRFFTNIHKSRPYIILKWAETSDGFVAQKDGSPVSISGSIARLNAHRWRSEEDAICVGSSTVINDNPELTTRNWPGRNPIRVVWDPNSQTSSQSRVYNEKSQTIVYGGPGAPQAHVKHGELHTEEMNLVKMAGDLYRRGIGSILVEGGPRLHRLFIESGLYDEIRIFKSKTLELGEGIPAAAVPAGVPERDFVDLQADILRIFSC